MSDIVISGDGTNSARYDLSGLNAFVKQFGKKHVLKVGILGTHASRKEAGPSNAEIGAVHEFGSYMHKIPMRSFLRMPLHSRAPQIVAEGSKGALELLAAGNVVRVFQNIGVACVGVITEAFFTKGFGRWKQLKPATILNKIQQNPAPLMNTQQLQRNVTFKVEKI